MTKIIFILMTISLFCLTSHGLERSYTSGWGICGPSSSDVVLAEWVNPSNPLQICEGSQVSSQILDKCLVNGTPSLLSFCSSMIAPQITLQSPAGTINTPISNGSRSDYCALGSTSISSTFSCNQGFIENAGACVPDSLSFSKIARGGQHSCAIATNGNIYCWGQGSAGRLGDGLSLTSLKPVKVVMSGVLNGKTVTDITSGNDHSCVIADGQAYCWGYGYQGQIGNSTSGSSANYSVPVAVTTSGVLSGKTLTSISAGASHTCALSTEGKIYCWGGGSEGQLGNGATGDSSNPVAVVTSGVLNGKSLTAISGGFTHNCAIDSTGKAYCWGYGAIGQLGDGLASNRSTVPVAVSTSGILSGKILTSISSGGYHSCALDNQGKSYCWGNGTNGQLGNASTEASFSPVAVSTVGVLSDKSITAISLGFNYSCAIADSKSYCWGANGSGQLGRGTTGNSIIPVAVDASGVLSGKNVTKVSSGDGGACVIADSKAYCWGFGQSGQLGNDSTSDSYSPVKVVDSIP